MSIALSSSSPQETLQLVPVNPEMLAQTRSIINDHLLSQQQLDRVAQLIKYFVELQGGEQQDLEELRERVSQHEATKEVAESITDACCQIFSKNDFSTEELSSVTAFLETPAGQKWQAVSPELAYVLQSHLTQVALAVGQEILPNQPEAEQESSSSESQEIVEGI